MFFEELEWQKNCEINSVHQKAFGAGWNDVWASKCQLQLARMASCKNDFLCSLHLQMVNSTKHVNNIVTLFYSHRTMGWQSQENILVFKKFLQVRPRMNNRIPSVTNNNITRNLSFTGCDLYYTVNHLKKVSTVTRHFNVVWWLNRKTLKAAVIFW